MKVNSLGAIGMRDSPDAKLQRSPGSGVFEFTGKRETPTAKDGCTWDLGVSSRVRTLKRRRNSHGSGRAVGGVRRDPFQVLGDGQVDGVEEHRLLNAWHRDDVGRVVDARTVVLGPEDADLARGS